MKLIAALSALSLAASAAAAVSNGNATITIFTPKRLQNVGSPGSTFGITLGEVNTGSVSYESEELSLVIGLSPCGDNDCGNPAKSFGSVLYEGKLETSDSFINVTIPEGFLSGRASLHLFHAALFRKTSTSALEVFTEIKSVEVTVAP